MRVVFMGTPEFGVPPLEYLLLSRHEVVAVYTPPDRPAGRGRKLVAPHQVFGALAFVAAPAGLQEAIRTSLTEAWESPS